MVHWSPPAGQPPRVHSGPESTLVRNHLGHVACFAPSVQQPLASSSHGWHQWVGRAPFRHGWWVVKCPSTHWRGGIHLWHPQRWSIQSELGLAQQGLPGLRRSSLKDVSLRVRRRRCLGVWARHQRAALWGFDQHEARRDRDRVAYYSSWGANHHRRSPHRIRDTGPPFTLDRPLWVLPSGLRHIAGHPGRAPTTAVGRVLLVGGQCGNLSMCARGMGGERKNTQQNQTQGKCKQKTPYQSNCHGGGTQDSKWKPIIFCWEECVPPADWSTGALVLLPEILNWKFYQAVYSDLRYLTKTRHLGSR